MDLKKIRNKYNLTVEQVSKACNVPIRTYLRYEKDENYGSDLKRQAIYNSLIDKYEITEEKGILSIEFITEKCKEVFEKYEDKIKFCYLFGSYSKNRAEQNSDVDLLIGTELTGFDFLMLINELKNELCKKIDLLRLTDQNDNIELIEEIMKDGIKIYG